MDEARVKLLVITGDGKEADRLTGMIGGADGSIFETATRSGLQEGFEYLSGQQVNVVLLDNSLLGRNWVEVFRRMHSGTPNTAVILLVDAFDPGLATKALRAGAQDCLVKNELDSSSLTRAIHFAIERKHDTVLKEGFISDASHELRTPLSILKLTVGNMRKSLTDILTEDLEKMLNMAESNVDRLVKFINNLLDLARLESGRENLNRNDISLEPIVHEVVTSFEVEAKDRELALEVATAPDLPTVFADEYMMERIFNNLLSNAMRFAGTKVTVQLKKIEKISPPEGIFVHCSEEETVCINCLPEGVQVSVMDDGEGIPADRLGDLFNKFTQLKNLGGNGGHKGTGLGLAISKEIVNSHNGFIWVESSPDEGTRFNVVIPTRNGSS